jgi:GNAT superfamily N-acetyltransferase
MTADGVSGITHPTPTTRHGANADRAEIARLITLAGEELDGRKGAWLWARFNAPAGTAESIAAALVDEPLTLVGLIDDVIVGFATGRLATLHDGVQTLGIIDGLYVEPGGRSIGVGDALVLDLMNEFRALGCVGVDAWALPGERETKNFYEAHAFSARAITVHHSFIGPTHRSRTEGLRVSNNSQPQQEAVADTENDAD